MSAKERKRANNRKIRQYNRATGKTNSRERTPLQKTIYCLITLVVTGVILFGIVTFFTPSSINEKMDQLKKMDYPQGYSEFVTKYSKEYNVDEDLVYAVIRTESHFENDSQSGAGAMGLVAWGTYSLSMHIIKSNIVSVLVSIAIAACVYFALVVILKILDEEEIKLLPMGDKILKIIKRK